MWKCTRLKPPDRWTSERRTHRREKHQQKPSRRRKRPSTRSFETGNHSWTLTELFLGEGKAILNWRAGSLLHSEETAAEPFNQLQPWRKIGSKPSFLETLFFWSVEQRVQRVRFCYFCVERGRITLLRTHWLYTFRDLRTHLGCFVLLIFEVVLIKSTRLQGEHQRAQPLCVEARICHSRYIISHFASNGTLWSAVEVVWRAESEDITV